MERRVGTVSRGLRGPIVKEGEDLSQIVIDTVMDAANAGEFTIQDRDIIAVTESILARSQSNYATTDQLAKDVKAKLGGETIGVVFPILSRNRFAICLRGIAKGAKKIVLQLSYPSDEVGNHLVDIDLLDEKGINPYSDVLTQTQFEELFGISETWLLTGKGEMVIGTVVQNNQNGNNIHGNTVNYQGENSTEKLIEMLKKKDEQIDRLLSLLEMKYKQNNNEI